MYTNQQIIEHLVLESRRASNEKVFFLELNLLDLSSPKSSRQCHEKDRVIHKLLNLVENTLQNGRNSEILSGVSSAVLCLDNFFRKLTLLSNSTEDNFDERCLLEDMKTSNDASTSDTRISHEEMELNSLNNEL